MTRLLKGLSQKHEDLICLPNDHIKLGTVMSVTPVLIGQRQKVPEACWSASKLSQGSPGSVKDLVSNINQKASGTAQWIKVLDTMSEFDSWSLHGGENQLL